MSATTGITIKIDANSAAAAAQLQQFFNGVTSGLNKLTAASSFIEGLGAQLAGLFTVGAMVKFTHDAIDSADAMQKLSERTGVAVTTLGALKQLGASRDLSFEQINTGLSMFNARLFAAAHQGGPVMQIFRDLGGGLDKLVAAGASSDVVLKAVADRFKQLNDPQLLGFASRELFGRGGAEWVNTLKVGGEEIANIAATKTELADTAEESQQFNRTLTQLNQQFKSLWTQVAGQLLPYLKEFSDWLLVSAKNTNSAAVAADALVRFFKGLVVEGFAVIAVFQTVSAVLANQLVYGLQILENDIAAIIKLAQLWMDSFHAVQDVLTSLLARLYILGQAMDEALHGHWKDARATAAGAATGISDDFAAAYKRLTGNATNAFATVKDTIVKNFGSAKSYVADTFSDVSAIWKKFTDDSLNLFDPAKTPNPFAPKEGAGAAAPGGNSSIISDEAKKLIDEIDKAYAEATKGKIALLDLEEQALKDKVAKEIFDTKKAEEEKTKITEIYARKRVEIQQKMEDEQAAIAFAKTEGKRKQIESDPLATDAQKAAALIPVLQTQLKLTDDLMAVNERRVKDPALSDEARINAEKELVKLQQQRVELGRQLQESGSRDSFVQQFAGVVVKLQNQLPSLAQVAASTFQNVFTAATNSISRGITGLIEGTMTWGQALRSIYNDIMNEIISAIVSMGVRWVMTQIMMAIAGKSIMAAAIAATAPLAAAQAAVWVAPATLSTIATLGASALAAPGFIGAAEAMTLGLSAFAEGGRPEPGKLALVGERGPELFIPDMAGTIIPAHQTAAMLQGGGSRAAGGAMAGGNKSNISVYGFTDPDQMAEHLQRNDDHEKWVVDVMRRNIHKFRG